MLEKHWQEQRERIKSGQVLGRDPLNPGLFSSPEVREELRSNIQSELERLANETDDTRESLRARLARALARRGTE